MLAETLIAADGTKILLRTWAPDSGARGVVVINHGFKSHSGLYEWVAEQFVARGLAVYAHDMRGHGDSAGERFYVEKFSDYVADLEQVITLAKRRHRGLPVFLLGHSAGGVVGCLYALEHQNELTGFVCESFAHEVAAPDVALAFLKGLSHIAPHAHVLKLKDEDFSRDPAFVERMKNDPRIVHEPGATQTVAEMIRADERLKKEFGNITLPVLILHGTADKATMPHGSEVFHERAGSTDKTLRLYEGHFHDLLNDVGKEDVLTDIVSWIDERLPS
ncbi:alpha/beta hydrolase [Sandaracinus amylolyticus]|uniref:alpha/beta hydrolase n=1 Tax=Sandaracinus amylolyticus TaxID=927083 RepID=UPI001F47DAFA|nr:alpha/beta hydrolase [Sandaracinus amylolyticus]UJR83654.1 Hypothetical protein I5071_57230 [Sandaracinus amylolyticus]